MPAPKPRHRKRTSDPNLEPGLAAATRRSQRSPKIAPPNRALQSKNATLRGMVSVLGALPEAIITVGGTVKRNVANRSKPTPNKKLGKIPAKKFRKLRKK